MAIIKSSTDHLTLNADGASKDIKFQANGVEKASISSAGAFTSTTIDATKLTGDLPVISGAALTGVGGLYASVAVIQDQKATNTSGGTFTSGAWRTRDLNTEVSDTDGIVSIASNQFTLQTGTYTLGWSAPGYDVDAHRTRIYNTSDAASVGEGSNVYTDVGGTVSIIAVGYTVFTIASGPKTFELQHFSAVTKSANGFGTNCNFSGEVEVYATVKILKHA